MRRSLWILLTIFVAGLIILVLPDDGQPVFQLNKMHGPSVTDLTGLVLMLAVWLASCVTIITRRKKLINRAGKRNVYLLLGFYFLFVSGIITALIFSFEWLLWPCVAVAATINMFFIFLAYSADRPSVN